jgi:hypothetical protein
MNEYLTQTLARVVITERLRKAREPHLTRRR